MTTGSSLTVSRQMEHKNRLSLCDLCFFAGCAELAGILRSRSESRLTDELDLRGLVPFGSASTVVEILSNELL